MNKTLLILLFLIITISFVQISSFTHGGGGHGGGGGLGGGGHGRGGGGQAHGKGYIASNQGGGGAGGWDLGWGWWYPVNGVWVQGYLPDGWCDYINDPAWNKKNQDLIRIHQYKLNMCKNKNKTNVYTHI
jgi:hypothetical protein